MIQRVVVRNAAALAVGGIVAQLCFVTIEAVIARTLGREAYGIYGSVYALSMIGASLLDLGLAWKLIEEGSRDRAKIATFLGTSLVIKLVLAVLLYPAVLGGLHLLGYAREVVAFLAVFFPYAVLLMMQDSLAATYSARQRMHVSAAYQAMSPLAILLAVALATTLSPDLTTIGFAYVGGALGVTLLWYFRTAREEHPRVDLSRGLGFVRGSYHYGVTKVLYELCIRLDVIVLAYLQGRREVGLLVAADKFSDLGVKVGLVATRALSPMLFAQSHADPDSYQRSARLVLRGTSAISVLGCLALALLAQWLLELVFGKAFLTAGPVLVILSASLAMRLLALALEMILSASAEHARRNGSLLTALLVTGTLSFMLIPTLGAVGAACARLGADSTYTTVMLASRRLPIPRARALWAVLPPLVLGVVAYVATERTGVDGLARCAIGLAIYVALLFVTGTVRRGDLRISAAISKERRRAE